MTTPGIVLYTDGACLGNPGPGGWGVLQVGHADASTHLAFSGGCADTTNNRMELTAVIEALKTIQTGSSATVCSDSKYVLDGINGWIKDWKRRGWKTSAGKPVKNQDLWQVLDGLNSARNITYRWVKGHAGNPGNEMADSLANAAAGKAKNGS